MAAGAATAIPGLSTLGIKFGWATGTKTTKPVAYTQIERCNSIGGISLDTEQIDASALEDYVSRYVAGRQDTGGTWTVSFNLTDVVVTQLQAMISAYNALDPDEDTVMFFTVYHPRRAKAIYVIAQPPLVLPAPEEGQNELEVLELTFTIAEYLGYDTAIEPVIAA